MKSQATILVVDDEPDVRTLCRVNLEYEGYKVVEASNGSDAFQRLNERRPDLILLDLMMPQMDGWEVMRRLKEDESTAAIPVILLTARADDDSQLKALDEGVLDYITKPFNPLSLVKFVERILKGRDPEEEMRRRNEIVQQLQRIKELRKPPRRNGS